MFPLGRRAQDRLPLPAALADAHVAAALPIPPLLNAKNIKRTMSQFRLRREANEVMSPLVG